MEDSKFWLCFWAIVGTFIILMAIIVSAGILAEQYVMVSNGYEEVFDPAAPRVLWKKKGN